MRRKTGTLFKSIHWSFLVNYRNCFSSREENHGPRSVVVAFQPVELAVGVQIPSWASTVSEPFIKGFIEILIDLLLKGRLLEARD